MYVAPRDLKVEELKVPGNIKTKKEYNNEKKTSIYISMYNNTLFMSDGMHRQYNEEE